MHPKDTEWSQQVLQNETHAWALQPSVLLYDLQLLDSEAMAWLEEAMIQWPPLEQRMAYIAWTS